MTGALIFAAPLKIAPTRGKRPANRKCALWAGGHKGLCLMLVLPVLLGAKADKWVRLAEQDLTFARALTREAVSFGPDFISRVVENRVVSSGCTTRPSKLHGLDSSQLRQLQFYSENYCWPWWTAWSRALRPCDSLIIPDWCKGGNEMLAVEHLKFSPYFETLTAALRAGGSPLERHNIMAVIANRLGNKALRDYPQSEREAWAASAAAEFLEQATADDALAAGWLLLLTPLEDSPSLAQLFRRYATRVQDISGRQRQLFDAIARGLEGGILDKEGLDELRSRFGPPLPPPPPPPPPDRTDPADIALLLTRIDAYYRLLKDEKYTESWGLLEPDSRAIYSSEEYVQTEEYMRRHGLLLDWQTQKIQVKGDKAKVFLEARYKKTAGLFRRKEESIRKEEPIWSFENGTWYMMLPGPPFWEEGNPIDVPLPK